MWYSEVTTPPNVEPNGTLSVMEATCATPIKFHARGTRAALSKPNSHSSIEILPGPSHRIMAGRLQPSKSWHARPSNPGRQASAIESWEAGSAIESWLAGFSHRNPGWPQRLNPGWQAQAIEFWQAGLGLRSWQAPLFLYDTPLIFV